ncbi:response regulator transcription factor [Actinomadura sp. ATCC 31491]|uniref:Response regulator transcription factor n=1 Tax=Actinomadura luzonensis TaxID=2805427 RepID=A0ABT0FUW8_9ACTN|nr:response regulator transcription factor [Actinomadura luzonensis]MCK2216126.1 response regulator transcription factor [Actinomadura luzonensis]
MERDLVPVLVPVLVVDDLPSYRRAVAGVIAVTDGFELAGEAASGEEALSFLREHPVGVVLMDVNMPGMGGLEAARLIRCRHPEVLVVLLSVAAADDLPAGALAGGAHYRHKDRFGPDELEALWHDGGSGGS